MILPSHTKRHWELISEELGTWIFGDIGRFGIVISKMERKLLSGTIVIPHLGHVGVGFRISCCLLLSSQKF